MRNLKSVWGVETFNIPRINNLGQQMANVYENNEKIFKIRIFMSERQKAQGNKGTVSANYYYQSKIYPQNSTYYIHMEQTNQTKTKTNSNDIVKIRLKNGLE